MAMSGIFRECNSWAITKFITCYNHGLFNPHILGYGAPIFLW